MIWRRLGGALVVFVVLTWAASLPIAHRWDERVTVWLQHAAPAPDVPAAALVFLGNAEVVFLAVILGAAYFFRSRQDPALGGAALWLAAGLIGVSLLAVALKHLIVHPGPPPALQRPIFRLGLHADTPYSFPSGHTLRTTLLAGVVLRGAPWLAGLAVLGMMTALVYLGDHWLSDVLGGLCLGWAAVQIAGAIRTARSPSCPRG
jgi:membrane-associated phospholipid phosphatase